MVVESNFTRYSWHEFLPYIYIVVIFFHKEQIVEM